MFTKEDLRHGLEWIEGKTKLIVDCDGSNLDIVLYTDYPVNKKYITLFLSIDESSGRVRVIDLVGNGHSTGLQNQGYGILIFNIGIQALHIFYNMKLGAATTEKITISGTTSNSGDPENEPERSQCRDRRNGFWMDYGFKLSEPTAFKTAMKARMCDLQLRAGAPTANGASRLIQLDQFWLKENAPILHQADVQKLMSIGFEQFNLDACPSTEDLNQISDAAIDWSNGIRLILLFFIGAGVLCTTINFFDPFTAIGTALLGLVCGYFFLDGFYERLLSLTPHYEKYSRLSDIRRETVSAIKNYIIKLEDEHNGLLWRLHQHLGTREPFKNDTFKELAHASKQQNPYYLADNYQVYTQYITAAKIALST